MSQRYLAQTPLVFDQNKNGDNLKKTLQIPLLNRWGMPMLFNRQQRSHLGRGVQETSPNKNIFCVLLRGEPARCSGLLSCEAFLLLSNHKLRWIALQMR